jgi:dihydroorotate dehydrogenase electron transfer subunit
VLGQHRSGDRYWTLELDAPRIAETAQPGQFVMLTSHRIGTRATVLPRPMAVSATDPERGSVLIMYGVVGAGTQLMTTLEPGETVVTVGPLGRGFDIGTAGRSVLVLGRGIGICSLTMLAIATRTRGDTVRAVSSGRTPDAIVGRPVYAAAGIDAQEVYDSDGSSDPRTVATWLRSEYDGHPPDLVVVCGSERLTALAVELGREWKADVQVSVEAHMACGIGYCHGCSSGDLGESVEAPLVCTDGPVFRIAESSAAHLATPCGDDPWKPTA